MIFAGNRMAVLTSESPMKFFELAQGGQLREDFSRGTNYAWTIVGDEGDVNSISYPDGALRIQADEGTAPPPITLTPPTWWQGETFANPPHCADIAISVGQTTDGQ